ncbi:MAG TPA: transcriptional regulator [Thermoanaerobaculia bacterium]|nr:transcriptional regulator [Thermoanaerobaculia bacterium]
MKRTALAVALVVATMLVPAPAARAQEGCQGSVPPAAAERQARRVVAELRTELAAVEDEIRHAPFLDALEQGTASRDLLRALAGEQYHILRSDLRSMAALVARVEPRQSLFFQDLLAGERIALGMLLDFAGALGWDEADLAAYEPRPPGQTYPNYVTRLAHHGSGAAAAASFLINFPVFGENTGRVRDALQAHYGLDATATAFFDFFATPVPGFEEAALEVIAAGFERCECAREVKRSARLLQAYERDFWYAVGEAP